MANDRRQRLDKLGFIWDQLEADWSEGFSCLQAYTKREGHCRVPQSWIENDFRLGQWVSVQRQSQNKDALSEERRQRLDKLGFIWDPFEADWEEGFRYLTMYKEREGHCAVPALHKENGFALGGWVRSKRFHKDRLSEQRQQRLEELGFAWEVRGRDAEGGVWDKGFRYLTIYKDREGHCRVPANHMEDGYPLGRWTDKQRQRREDLSDKRQQKLNEIGFVWDVLDAAWEKGFRYLTLYKTRTGHCRVPALHKEHGYRLGQWASVQRLNKDGLSNERQQRLADLGFVWDPHGIAWEEGFKHLQAFVKEHNHCRVPTNYKSTNGYALGRWIVQQRTTRDALSIERKRRLDALGFVWNARIPGPGR